MQLAGRRRKGALAKRAKPGKPAQTKGERIPPLPGDEEALDFHFDMGTQDLYLYGDCNKLALVIHKLFGLEIYGAVEPPSDVPFHYGCRIGDLMIDVSGIRSRPEFLHGAARELTARAPRSFDPARLRLARVSPCSAESPFFMEEGTDLFGSTCRNKPGYHDSVRLAWRVMARLQKVGRWPILGCYRFAALRRFLRSEAAGNYVVAGERYMSDCDTGVIGKDNSFLAWDIRRSAEVVVKLIAPPDTRGGQTGDTATLDLTRLVAFYRRMGTLGAGLPVLEAGSYGPGDAAYIVTPKYHGRLLDVWGDVWRRKLEEKVSLMRRGGAEGWMVPPEAVVYIQTVGTRSVKEGEAAAEVYFSDFARGRSAAPE